MMLLKTTMSAKNLQRRIVAITILWAVCVCAGIGFFAWYDVRSTSQSAAPDELPATTQFVLPTEIPSVAMFLHPRCACSHASLAEFAKLAREFGNQATFRIIFFKPASVELSWIEHDNLFAKAHTLASTLNNVHVSIDEGGKESERFHAEISGFIVAYNAAGKLLYNGGITGSRGHEGNNAGEAVLRKILHDIVRTSAMPRSSEFQYSSVIQSAIAPTFGCTLRPKQ
ncbi:MAG: hypothetical protein EAZ92_12815 [Candidatus Kapaibacterium sp.]|nr:MAG: hypothetical protein EAZ92_12815 [Candidatus Kapabacteria bacterium]